MAAKPTEQGEAWGQTKASPHKCRQVQNRPKALEQTAGHVEEVSERTDDGINGERVHFPRKMDTAGSCPLVGLRVGTHGVLQALVTFRLKPQAS